jgi:hypothetical protein
MKRWIAGTALGLLSMMAGAQVAAPAVPAQQTWFTVVTAAAQSQDINVDLPAGATYSFTAPNCASFVPVTVTAATTISDWDDGVDGRPADPCPGVAKELDVLRTAAAQTVAVNGTAMIVPALPKVVVLSAVYPPPCMSTSAGSCGGTWFGAAHMPENSANRTVESSLFTLTIDGTIYTCAYQPEAYAPNQFTFSCTVQTPAANPPAG